MNDKPTYDELVAALRALVINLPIKNANMWDARFCGYCYSPLHFQKRTDEHSKDCEWVHATQLLARLDAHTDGGEA